MEAVNANDEGKPEKISAGNDVSDGDARDEGRMDKDEDRKTGKDEDSPLAPHVDEKKKRITPDSLLTDNSNEHKKGNMDEHEEPDPTNTDAPELKTEYPGAK